MAVSVLRSRMWLRSIRPVFSFNPHFRSLPRNTPQYEQLLRYSGAPPAPDHDAPNTEKLQSTQNEQTSKSTSEAEVKSIEEAERTKTIKDLQEKLKDLQDKYTRNLAANENLRQRLMKEAEDAKMYAIKNFVRDVVEVADVLDKATESVPEESLIDNPNLKILFEGLQMTKAQLQTVFKRHGVVQINPMGQKFDPNLHEAIFTQADPTKDPGSIGTVTQVGYLLHDRIVRPAKVGVIKQK